MLRSTVAVLVASLAALAVLVAPAAAGTMPASGSFTEGPETILSDRLVGDREFIHLTRDAEFTGSYAGVGHADQRIVIQSDGAFRLVMTIDFTGTACGKSVAQTFAVTASGNLFEGVMGGKYAVVGPSKDGLGFGTFTGIPGVGGDYEGTIRC